MEDLDACNHLLFHHNQVSVRKMAINLRSVSRIAPGILKFISLVSLLLQLQLLNAQI
jgi:hypothetical protein